MNTALETPLAYCREKVCADTSSLHYAVLFQPDELKAFWLGCFTLNQELRQACMKQLEAGLTQVKLGWWRNALTGAQGNTNLHPVIKALHREVVAKVNPDQWAALIESVAQGCEPNRHNSQEDWKRAVQNEIRPWLALIQARIEHPAPALNGLFGATDKETLSNGLESLSTFWTHSTQLCQLLRMAKYLDEGFQPLPVQALAQANIPAEQLRKREHTEATSALFKHTAELLISQANTAWRATPKPLRLFARPLRALYRMKVAEWRLHDQSEYRLLTEQKVVTPLKKFALSWSTQVLRR